MTIFFTNANKSRRQCVSAYMDILCVSPGTQECKILSSSRFFPPAEDHSFSTRLSGQLSLLSVAPCASFLFTLSSFFLVYYNVCDLFWVLMCIFMFVCVLVSPNNIKKANFGVLSRSKSLNPCPPCKAYKIHVYMYACVSVCGIVAVHFLFFSL